MTYYQIFSSSLPMLPTGEKAFYALANLDSCRVITHREGDETVAFAAVEGEALRLLCVHPAWQKKGIGKKLLREAEEYILSQGGESACLGGQHSQLLLGAPKEAKDFFLRHGYGEYGIYDEMTGDLSRLLPSEKLPAPEDVSFGWYTGSVEALQKAVAAVDEDWVQYFSSTENVYCAIKDHQIASFCFADESENCLLSTGGNRVGVPGCVGTLPAFRRQGIGLKMVARACEELRAQGCDTGFIHYTGVAHWYQKLGFQVFLTQHFMRKKLTP